MPATTIAERIGCDRGITILKERVAELRPAGGSVLASSANRGLVSPGDGEVVAQVGGGLADVHRADPEAGGDEAESISLFVSSRSSSSWAGVGRMRVRSSGS